MAVSGATISVLLLLACAIVSTQGIHVRSHTRAGVRQQGTPANYPVVGVLAEPVDTELIEESGEPTTGSYFAANYVKWLEQAGVQVVPVRYDLPVEQLDFYFNSINAILFTGGSQSLNASTQYFQAAQHLFNRALEANDRGDYFPVWGTCMGYQLLTILGARNHSVLEHGIFDSMNIQIPLEFTSSARESRMFKDAPAEVFEDLGSKNITLNLHHDGIPPMTYTTNANLSDFYTLLSTNQDLKGNSFGSTMEGKKYPVYAVQWHPERNQFVWGQTEIDPRSLASIRAMQYMAQFLAGQARMSSHRFTDLEAQYQYLIYQYQPTFTGAGTGITDTQKYFFPAYSADEKSPDTGHFKPMRFATKSRW